MGATSRREELPRGRAGRASIVAACHDEPDLGDGAGVDVQVERVSFPEPSTVREGGRDKARKRRFGAAWLWTALADADVYVMAIAAEGVSLVGHGRRVTRRLRRSW